MIHTFRDDFPKYIGNRSLVRIQHVFNFAARVLGKVHHSHCNGLPLQAEADDKSYKLLFLDIGLMNALCGLGWQQIGSLQGVQLVNEGALAEQFIGQHLQALLADSPNRDLTYWLREGRANNAELDHVVAMHGRIVPIEVKAGASGRLKSLMQFVAEKQARTAIRFDASPPSLQTVDAMVRRGDGMERVKFQLQSLPLYLVEALPRVVASR